jgi:hypothetical protein
VKAFINGVPADSQEKVLAIKVEHIFEIIEKQ